LRLLLDEHFSTAIAEQLRKRGHDVIAAAALPDLRHRDDAEVLVWAIAQRRVVVTEDAVDYLALHEQHLSRGLRHRGIVLTSSRRFPRSRDGIGRLVRALDGLLRSRPGDNSLLADVMWL
jgi:predicted nuclease of predicted toxin-antitoxin system